MGLGAWRNLALGRRQQVVARRAPLRPRREWAAPGGMNDRLDAHAEIRIDAIVDADAEGSYRLDRTGAGKDTVDRVSGIERSPAEARRPHEVDPSDDIGRHLAEIVSYDGRAAGKSVAGELGEPRVRPGERHVAGRALHPHHETVIEHMFVGEVGLAAEPALHPLASPGRDARPDRKARPIIGRDVSCVGVESRIAGRRAREVSRSRGPNLKGRRHGANGYRGKESDDETHGSEFLSQVAARSIAVSTAAY